MVAAIKMMNTSAPSNKEFNFAFRDVLSDKLIFEA